MFGHHHHSAYHHHLPPYAHGRAPLGVAPHAHGSAHASALVLDHQDYAVNFSHRVAHQSAATGGIQDILRKRKRAGDSTNYGFHASSVSVNEIYAISEVKSATTVFNWNIQNFHDICHSQTQLDIDGQPMFVPFRSSAFTAGAEVNKHSEWYVRMQPTSVPSFGGRNGLRQPCVLIILCLDKLLSRTTGPINARFAVLAANQLGTPISVTGFVGYQTHIFQPLNGSTNYNAYAAAISAPFILMENFSSTTTTLCIQIKLEIVSDPTPSIEPVGGDRKLNAESDLLRQISELYTNKQGSDVIIECGTDELHAHKTILSARSPVFARMFEHDMIEKSTHRIKIDDVDSCVMEEMLKYVYTGVLAIPFDFDMLQGILHAADKYELEKLKVFCMEELFRHISHDNAGHVQVLAYLHNVDNAIKDKIRGYIEGNCIALWKKASFRKFLVEYPKAFGDSGVD